MAHTTPQASLFNEQAAAEQLPDPEQLKDGLAIERVFSEEGEHPFDSLEWELREASIKNPKGEAIFEQKEVEFPTSWSQLATNVVSSKYFYGDLAHVDKEPEDGGRERSLKQLIHRVTRTIADWGKEQGYFASEEDGERFYDELTWLCVNQYGAFNSPVWFNVGLHHEYGVTDTGDKKIYGWDPDRREAVAVDPYERPQASACFIISVEDSIDDIWQLMSESARLFKFGSGVGADWSTLRSTREKLSGGGVPSGPVSFMRVQDATGGTIKSGGKCLAPHQRVYTAEHGAVAVKDLDGQTFTVLSYHPPAGRVMAKRAQAWKSGRKDVVRIKTDKGTFDLSHDHPVRLAGDAGVVRAGDLTEGMRLHAASVDAHSEGYPRVHLQNGEKGKALLHRLVARDVMGADIDGCSVHHKDENIYNADPANLDILSQADHAALHAEETVEAGEHVFQNVDPADERFDRSGERNGMHRSSDFWDDAERVASYRETQRQIMAEERDPRAMQRSAVVQRYLNQGWQLLNAGHDISTVDAFFDAYQEEIGRIDSKPRRRQAFKKQFGSYDSFLAALDEQNHTVQSVQHVGASDVYSVEVFCDTPDDKTTRSGHNFLVWPHEADAHVGRGVFVFNTRRAAIMQTLKVWHPDIMEFVEAKATEEKKAWALIEQGYDGSFNGPAYGSVAFQNVNQSVRVTDAFMKAAEKRKKYGLKAVLSGEVIEQVDAAEVLDKIAEGTHVCGDPGLQYEDTIQRWHTCKNTAPINSSNPCCFVGDTLVHTTDGVLSFDELYARVQQGVALPQAVSRGVAVLPDGEAELEDVESDIRSVWVAGHTKELVDVHLSNGSTLRCTPEHRFLCRDGLAWTEAQDLRPGTVLVALREGQEAPHVVDVQAVYLDEPVAVYDMEVADVHAFGVTDATDVDGVIVHNSEYMFLDNSACNLASLNLRKYQREDGSFDVERYRAAARIFITAMEILVDNAGYPSKSIAENSHRFRPLGLGFANLGAALMAMGLPYDSDEGRAVAGALMAIEHCEAYARSAEIAANPNIEPFEGYAENTEPFLDVMQMHHDAVNDIDPSCPDYLLQAAMESADRMVAVGRRHGYRNAQATVLAPTGCLVENSLISTDRGLVRLRTLGNTEGETWQDTDFQVFTDGGPQKATKFYVNGEAPTRRIRTSSGYTIQGTHKHKVKVVNPDTGMWTWKRFDEIESGDIVPLAMNTLMGEPREVSLPPLGDLHWNADYATRVPRTVTPALAELVGYFMGDGSLHAKGLRFCVADEDAEVVARLSELVRSLFNLETYVEEQTGYLEVGVHSVPLTLWWKACGFAKLSPQDNHSGKGYQPYVPDALLHSNDPAVYHAFLRGLFEADGTLTDGVPTLCTASRDFAQEIKSLLLALGYPTHSKKDQGGWGGQTHVLRLKNRSYNAPFRKDIGFMSRRKQDGIRSASTRVSARRDRIYIDRTLVEEVVPAGSEHRDAVLLSLRRHDAVARQRVEQIYEDTGDERLVRYMGFFYDTVETNEDGGIQPTYDLSVPANVTYTANGFVSHNTISFMMDCDTTGIEPDIALVKYKLLAGEGDGMLKIVNRTVPLALKRLGYNEDEVMAIVEYIDNHDTIEGAPVLKDEHLDVFDCAFAPANGERSIHHMGHIKMMAATQPFVSGAISKTVNMPEHASEEDIADAYLQGWALGLKALAIYRENSKRSQPLSTSEGGNTKQKEQAVEASSDGAAAGEPEVVEKVVYKPVRKRLPDERPSLTHKFSIAGHEGYLHIGLYPETHMPGEIFITMAKQGSTIAGLMDAFATSISIALQYGVPLEDLCTKFSHMRFEPSGFTNNKQVPIAKSIMDYIFRYLSLKFLGQSQETAEETVDPNQAVAEEADRSGPAQDETQMQLSFDGPTEQPSDGLVGETIEAFMERSGNGHTATGAAGPAKVENLEPSFQNQADAPPCSNCGAITVRSGACYVCTNCGATSGCG